MDLRKANGRHPPRMRGIQYAAAFRFFSLTSLEYWITRLREGFAEVGQIDGV